jgi:hypothetical protein
MFETVLEEGKAALTLAKWDGISCGLCCYGPSRDEDLRDSIEIISFYTLPEYWGKEVDKARINTVLS